MAIDLNHDRYGAQFDAFVDFASTQRNPGCVEGQKPGQFLRGRDSRATNSTLPPRP